MDEPTGARKQERRWLRAKTPIGASSRPCFFELFPTPAVTSKQCNRQFHLLLEKTTHLAYILRNAFSNRHHFVFFFRYRRASKSKSSWGWGRHTNGNGSLCWQQLSTLTKIQGEKFMKTVDFILQYVIWYTNPVNILNNKIMKDFLKIFFWNLKFKKDVAALYEGPLDFQTPFWQQEKKSVNQVQRSLFVSIFWEKR